MLVSTLNLAESSTLSAAIAGELFWASKVAQQLSLVSKNSRALVLRAGDRAAGLKVISDYFGEVAARTIQLSGEINHASVSISSNSVRQWKLNNLLRHLERAEGLLAGSSRAASLHRAAGQAGETIDTLRDAFSRDLAKLERELDEIASHLRASSVVSTTFRLEATHTGMFQRLLVDMATNIEALSRDIAERVKRSQHMLRRMTGEDGL